MATTFLTARWENIIMANYKIDPDLLQPYLPHGVVLDTYDNAAYVSLVGFMFVNTSLFRVPIPFFGSFEEVNLRFYVKRVDGAEVKRGVVFINETVPFQVVATLANKLYREHYISIPTRHANKRSDHSEFVQYEWNRKDRWNRMEVNVGNNTEAMQPGSIEEFIFEHYYGYNKFDQQLSQEYRVNHPRWKVNPVIDYKIDCDFGAMYGDAFSVLNGLQPDSVIMSKGSAVSIDWKRRRF